MLRLNRRQVREIDRLAAEQYHIPGLVLMENAARSAADVACDLLDGNCGGQVLILVGGGNNGGDGLALARHLHNRGAEVEIALSCDPAKFRNEAMENWKIVQAMQLPCVAAEPEGIRRSSALLIVDAIFGTGLSEAPRDPFRRIVEAVADSRVPVLAIDLPSGLDCDAGQPLGPTIRATCTVSFVAEKIGFAAPGAGDYLGRVIVGDIGCPRELIEQVARGQ